MGIRGLRKLGVRVRVRGEDELGEVGGVLGAHVLWVEPVLVRDDLLRPVLDLLHPVLVLVHLLYPILVLVHLLHPVLVLVRLRRVFVLAHLRGGVLVVGGRGRGRAVKLVLPVDVILVGKLGAREGTRVRGGGVGRGGMEVGGGGVEVGGGVRGGGVVGVGGRG